MFKKTLRAATVTLASTVLAFGAAGTVFAQDDADNTPKATISGGGGYTVNGTATGTSETSFGATQIFVTPYMVEDAVSSIAYCIEITKDLLGDNIYEGKPWADLQSDTLDEETLGKVLAVLSEGYGSNSADDLFTAAGVEGEWSAEDKEKVAYSGTQISVWHLTDGFELNADDPTAANDTIDAAVQKIYDHLGQDFPAVPEPIENPTFDIDKSAYELNDGVAGPVTAITNMGEVTFSQPVGARIVDGEGNELTSLMDGDEFYVDLDSEETTEITLQFDQWIQSIPVGQTWVATGEKATEADAKAFKSELSGQRLIQAEVTEYPVDVAITFTVNVTEEEVPPVIETPSTDTPTPSEAETTPVAKLPTTGTTITWIAGAAAALLIAGVGTMLVLRRKNATASSSDWS